MALIMDGNGRWGEARGLGRSAGHQVGAEALRPVVAAAGELGIGTLTAFAFSSDNWRRPAVEVRLILDLLARHLEHEARDLAEQGVRLEVIGRRDRLPASLVEAIERAEALTAEGSALDLVLAVDYSSREALDRGDRRPDVDLLIRTGGEQRLSDFLLRELAYAELYFTPCLWPDFGPEELRAAIEEFQRRDRRFGALPGQTAATGGR